MYALSIGISRVSTTLPLPVYALLSGLNAAVVGVIAFSAVQLATKAITDPLSRIIVIASACAGLCYNALWYFPVLMIIGGLTTLVWDLWMRGHVGRLRGRWRNRRREITAESHSESENLPRQDIPADPPHGKNFVSKTSARSTTSAISSVPLNILRTASRGEETTVNRTDTPNQGSSQRTVPANYGVSVKLGIGIIVAFFGVFGPYFETFYLLRTHNKPRLQQLWWRMQSLNLRLWDSVFSGTCTLQVKSLRYIYDGRTDLDN
jgi:hypothetical protein